MIWRRKQKAAPVEAPAPSEQPALAEAIEAAGVPRAVGEAAAQNLRDLLLDIARRPDRFPPRNAVRMLGANPRALIRLDESVRRLPHPAAATEVALVRSPVSLAFGALHRDGRVREEAVTTMVGSPDEQWLPLLTLRSADWVTAVRDRARHGLAELLGSAPRHYLRHVLPMAVLIRDWRRGSFAYTVTMAALLGVDQKVRDGLLADAGPAGRHLLLELGLAQGWWPPENVLDLAAAPGEVRLRSRAAEAMCREAVWRNRPGDLTRWSRHPRIEVREVALTGLLRLGRHDEVVAHLDDRSPLIRAMARAAAGQSGVDALAHYRAAVTVAEPSPGAMAGLAEAGASADAARLVPFLAHPRSRVRAQAVRALRVMNAVPVGETVPLLQDPSPAVVREATESLRYLTRAVPTELAHRLLTDPDRVELRRAGYRLLRVRGPADRLHAALTLAGDPDPALSRQAVADATGLARTAAALARRRHDEPAIDAAAPQLADLVARLAGAAEALGPETTSLLRTYLAQPIG